VNGLPDSNAGIVDKDVDAAERRGYSLKPGAHALFA
jgi:hypothetical protein